MQPFLDRLDRSSRCPILDFLDLLAAKRTRLADGVAVHRPHIATRLVVEIHFAITAALGIGCTHSEHSGMVEGAPLFAMESLSHPSSYRVLWKAVSRKWPGSRLVQWRVMAYTNGQFLPNSSAVQIKLTEQ